LHGTPAVLPYSELGDQNESEEHHGDGDDTRQQDCASFSASHRGSLAAGDHVTDTRDERVGYIGHPGQKQRDDGDTERSQAEILDHTGPAFAASTEVDSLEVK
jgi:hypothetical protein